MHAKLTKKINVRIDAGDLHRLFRVLGSFENKGDFNDEIIKSDALLLLEELQDIRGILDLNYTSISATLEAEAQYEHSSTKITLGDLLIPGEKLQDVAVEEYETAPPLIDTSSLFGEETEAELLDRAARTKQELDQLRDEYFNMFGVELKLPKS